MKPGPVLGTEMIAGVLLVSAMIGLDLLWYSSVLRAGPPVSLVLSAVFLLLYGAAAWCARGVPEGPARSALRTGGAFGLVIGAVFVAHLFAEHFANLGRLDAALTLAVMGFVFLLFGATASRAAGRTGSFRLGLLAAVWAAMVGIVITCLCGFSFDLAFMARQEQNLHGAYLRSGLDDPKAFVVLNTLESAAVHLLEAPILAVVFGSIGGLIGLGLARRARHEPTA